MLVTIVLCGAMVAFAVAAVLLNEGEHATRNAHDEWRRGHGIDRRGDAL
jgi:hypothetical protein